MPLLSDCWVIYFNYLFLPNNHSQRMCKNGMIVPMWMSSSNPSQGNIVAHIVIYFIALAYIFVGLSIIEDRLLAAIEVITSKKKKVVITKSNGGMQTISVRLWNETVSNLSLMVLGSSAPVILLPLIEMIGYFQAGDLVSGTIVGSAAFNMFMIIAVCVWVIPNGENRKIKNLRVFIITMTWSVFAYIWLYIILNWSSAGIIEVWEGIVTFLFFPTTILTAYIADRRFFVCNYFCRKYQINKRGAVVESEEDVQLPGVVEMGSPEGGRRESRGPTENYLSLFGEEENEELKEFEKQRRKCIQLLREVRRINPKKSMEELEPMVLRKYLQRSTKIRAIYRLQATKKLTGGGNLIKKLVKPEHTDKEVRVRSEDEGLCCRIYFHPAHYTMMKSMRQFTVTVVRSGDLSRSVCVDFKTQHTTAEARMYLEPLVGTLVFHPGEMEQEVLITVTDDIFEQNKNLYVRLNNPHYLIHIPDAILPANICHSQGDDIPLELGSPSIATIMILKDDHPGVFGFTDSTQKVTESIGEFRLRVQRCTGVQGRVILPFRTLEGSAKPGRHYGPVDGVLVFESNENGKDILIQIMDEESYERDSFFYVELGKPRTDEDYLKEQSDQIILNPWNCGNVDLSEAENINLQGKPLLSEHYKIQIHINESKEFKNTVDNLIEKTNVSMNIGTSSWKEQFLDVITVRSGEDDVDQGDDEQRLPSCSDYVMHFFTFFWKVIFAFVPPTNCFGGWACFITSIAVIGVLTALVCDLAFHIGCVSGIKDSVTAILLVAIGINMPNIFACKVAAQNDKYADSSIGNVMCCNAVNVFLGVGLSWSIAAIYHAYFNRSFRMNPGNLSFSVTVFSVFAFVCCTILILRRSPLVGGELGGPLRYKMPTAILFASLWFFYVVLTILEAYGYILDF